jgi:hypothetical protein
MIYRLKSFSCPSFKCFFHLWGMEGTNWQWEFSAWSEEQASKWHVVTHQRSSLTGANSIPIAPGCSFAAVIRGNRSNLISSDQTPPSRPASLSNADRGPHTISILAQQPSPPSPAHLSSSSLQLRSDLICQRCLSLCHTSTACTSKIHCRGCCNYGHIAKNWLSHNPKTLIFCIKLKSPEPSPFQPPETRLVVPSTPSTSSCRCHLALTNPPLPIAHPNTSPWPTTLVTPTHTCHLVSTLSSHPSIAVTGASMFSAAPNSSTPTNGPLWFSSPH